MRYCTRCIIPDARPNILIDEAGVCSACRSHEAKGEVDWQAREGEWRAVVDNAKHRGQGYDCIVPVSGGKDSTWQVATCLDYGMKPLAVTWRPPGRNAVGERNLENLRHLGVDHVDFSINPEVEKKFTYEALKRYGDPGIPMHMAIFNIPLLFAARFQAPLVVWGENTAIEYAGDDEALMGHRLDAAWLKQYGVMHGTTWRDWVSEELSEQDLLPYAGPDPDQLECQGTTAVFLGYYFPYDPQKTFEAARARGFLSSDAGPKTGYYDYADIDDEFISIHHYLKWYKFGFTRLFDNLSLEIRNGRLTRDGAIAILRDRGDDTPHADIETFCQWLGISVQHFYDIIEPFRNQEIWEQHGGVWKVKDFLIEDWEWK